jgi:hypothetical protein
MGQMESEICVVVQMGSENCCDGSDGEREILCWVRWGVRSAVVVQMASELDVLWWVRWGVRPAVLG